MTEQTAKSIERTNGSVSLLVYPDTDKQRVVKVVQSNRDDRRQLALAQARAKYGNAPLAWFSHVDQHLEAVA